MKKNLALAFVFFASVSCIFADWTKIISAGVDIPFVSTTVEWDNDNGTDHETGKGFNLDGQFRLVKDNGFSFMWDFDAGYIDVGGDDGADCALIFGVGANLADSDDMKVILSGIIGVDAISLSYSSDYVYSGYSYDLDVGLTIANFMIGADLYISKKLSKVFGVFAQCTAGVGVGGATCELSLKRNGIKASSSIDGTSEIAIFKPKFGFCWTF